MVVLKTKGVFRYFTIFLMHSFKQMTDNQTVTDTSYATGIFKNRINTKTFNTLQHHIHTPFIYLLISNQTYSRIILQY